MNMLINEAGLAGYVLLAAAFLGLFSYHHARDQDATTKQALRYGLIVGFLVLTVLCQIAGLLPLLSAGEYRPDHLAIYSLASLVAAGVAIILAAFRRIWGPKAR